MFEKLVFHILEYQWIRNLNHKVHSMPTHLLSFHFSIKFVYIFNRWSSIQHNFSPPPRSIPLPLECICFTKKRTCLFYFIWVRVLPILFFMRLWSWIFSFGLLSPALARILCPLLQGKSSSLDLNMFPISQFLHLMYPGFPLIRILLSLSNKEPLSS